MVKCPKCERDIDYFKHYQSGEMQYIYNGEYEEKGFQADCEVADYECPECAED